MEMKKMPYKIEEGALEKAKYRAKMAVREVAHPTIHHSHAKSWRWVSAVAVAAVVVVGVIGMVKHVNEAEPLTPMEELFAEMKNAPDEVIYEWASDASFYTEDVVSL